MASGTLIRSGRLSDPLSGAVIRAPVFSLLRGIVECANDLVFMSENGACGAPTILVENVPIEGL